MKNKLPQRAQQLLMLNLIFISLTAKAEVLNLADYLDQVKEKNQTYQAASKSIDGAHGYADEYKLLTAPVGFAQVQSYDDKKPNPLIRAPGSGSDSLSFGVQQQTDFGLSGKLSYTFDSMDYRGLVPKYYEGRPSLDLTQSLWRNGFGAEVQAQKQALAAASEAKSASEQFRMKTVLLEAESSYWRLALARETRNVAHEALIRAEKIFAWNANRSKLGLGDRADMLQAEAALQARKIDLRSAEDEVAASARAFNSSRGIASEDVADSLEPIQTERFKAIQEPVRVAVREDLKAAQAQARALQANAELSREKYRPTLDAYGSFALNGNSNEGNQAIRDSFELNRTMVVGLKFSSPLDFGLLNSAREGYALEKVAADYNLQRKTFEQERDWSDLTKRFSQAKARLQMATELEKIQKDKLAYERDRHSRGRTTTYQILIFELDFEQAQLARIRTLAELLQINAQMKLYGVSYESR